MVRQVHAWARMTIQRTVPTLDAVGEAVPTPFLGISKPNKESGMTALKNYRRSGAVAGGIASPHSASSGANKSFI